MPFFRQDEQLAKIANQILQAARAQFPSLTRDKIALTWIVYQEPVIKGYILLVSLNCFIW